MGEWGDRLADAVQAVYARLGRKGKPASHEWTLLAGCCVTEGGDEGARACREPRVVAIATGTKCLGEARLNDEGDLLHDSHAEVLCRRALVRFLWTQVAQLAAGEDVEDGGAANVFRLVSASPLRVALRDGVQFHLYVSHAPCGDASISDEGGGDGPPAAKRARMTGARAVEENDAARPNLDRQQVGVVRTKPGRGPRTISMSCSDKLALWSIVGFQGALLARVLAADAPWLVFRTIAIGDEYVRSDAERALLGRVAALAAEPRADVVHTARPFADSRVAKGRTDLSGSCAIYWTPEWTAAEAVQASGRKMGANKHCKRPATRSSLCRRALFDLYRQVTGDTCGFRAAKDGATVYQALKTRALAGPLAGWIRSGRDVNEEAEACAARRAASGAQPVTGARALVSLLPPLSMSGRRSSAARPTPAGMTTPGSGKYGGFGSSDWAAASPQSGRRSTVGGPPPPTQGGTGPPGPPPPRYASGGPGAPIASNHPPPNEGRLLSPVGLVAVALTLIAFILGIIGVATTKWTTATGLSGKEIVYGLRKATEDGTEYSYADNKSTVLYRAGVANIVLLSFTIIFSVVAAAIGLGFSLGGPRRQALTASIVTLVVSIMFALPVIIWAAEIAEITLKNRSHGSSFILIVVACVLCLLAAILYIVAFKLRPPPPPPPRPIPVQPHPPPPINRDLEYSYYTDEYYTDPSEEEEEDDDDSTEAYDSYDDDDDTDATYDPRPPSGRRR